jgi:hypothetical protein
LSSTFEAIGNKLGKYVKTSEATLKGRYTSYSRICIEMDVSGALPESISLEFRNEEWIQSIDYEQISFQCKRCHEHGHLLRECPLNKKKQEPKNTKQQQDEDGFVKQITKAEETKDKSRPQQEATQKLGLEHKEEVGPTKGKKEARKRRKPRKQKNKQLMSTQRIQATRKNREAAQVLWKEETKTPTTQCRR